MYLPQHDESVGDNIGNAEVEGLQWVLFDEVLENHDGLWSVKTRG